MTHFFLLFLSSFSLFTYSHDSTPWINFSACSAGATFESNYQNCLSAYTYCTYNSCKAVYYHVSNPCFSPYQWDSQTQQCESTCVPGQSNYLVTPSTATTIDDFPLTLAPFNACSAGCSVQANASYRVSPTEWEHEYKYTGDFCDGSTVPSITTVADQSDVMPSTETNETDNSDPTQSITKSDTSEVVYNADGSTTTVRTETTTTTLADGSVIEETTTTTTIDNRANNAGVSTTSSTVTTNTDSQGVSTTQITATRTSSDTGQQTEEQDFGYGSGTASGSCDVAPSCVDGDPQLCAILNQQWQMMCSGDLVTPSSFESQLQSSGLSDPGITQSAFDASNTVNVDSQVQAALNNIDTSFTPGDCPLTNEQVSFFTETLTIDVTEVCNFIPLLANIIRAMAGVTACWVLLSGLARP